MTRRRATVVLIAIMWLTGCYRNKYPGHHGVPPDFVNDIAPLIFKNCSGCHSKDGMAPFSLTTYNQISNHAGAIHYMVKNRLMPPWKPDPTYSSFIGEVNIDSLQIDRIKWWIELGKPYGNPAVKPVYEPDQYMQTENTGPGWITLKRTTGFTHPGDGSDHYTTTDLVFDSTGPVYVNRIELVGQNKKILHHAWLGALPAGTSMHNLSADMINKTHLLAGFLPGMSYNYLPDGYAKVIPAGYKTGMQLHYAHSYKKETDHAQVQLHQVSGDSIKKVELYMILEDSLTNPPFLIKANEVKIMQLRHTIDTNLEILALTPHMHYRGKKFCAYAVNHTTHDTTPLIRVNDWDFNWQNIYYFKQPVVLKKGDVIYVSGTYDNTSRNPLNPVLPAVDINRGDRSYDEMLELLMEVVKIPDETYLKTIITN
ncbi:MAG TPA: hypothetical protein PLW44_02710 [Chitinophagales bacterium]|nr:hypothetical protein [Chitinophagales bacterium]